MITLTIHELVQLLERAAQEGINVSPTAGDYTAAGIAYHTYADYLKETGRG